MRYAKLTIVEERIVQSADGNFRFIEARETGETLIFPSVDKARECASSMTEDRFRDIGRGVFARRKAVVSPIEAFVADEADARAPIDDCAGISNRTRNVLKRCGIKSLAELSSITRDRALKIRNLGKIGLRELEAEMIKRGLSFKEE